MKKKPQPVENESHKKRRGISRRQMVQRLVGGAAGGVAMSSVASARPPAAQSASSPAPTRENGPESPTANWDSAVLDSHQMATLKAVAERIVPGSAKAGVAPFVNRLLSVDTLETQKAFLASLSAIDGESRRRYSLPFKELAEARQLELLKIVSAPVQPPASKSKMDLPPRPGSPNVLPSSVLHEHFENLKSWVTKVYYSSEIGLRELGWTDSYVWPDFPGCKDSGA